MKCRLPVSGPGPSKTIVYVLQTKQSSRAVERYQFSLKGKAITTYVFFSNRKTCTWLRLARPFPAARNRRRSRRAPVSTPVAITRRFLVSCTLPVPTWWGQETQRDTGHRGGRNLVQSSSKTGAVPV